MKGRMFFLVIGLALMAFGPIRSAAQIKVGGVIFLRHWTDLTDNGKKKGYDQFDLERVYLTYAQELNPKVKVRVTTDIFQNAGPSYYGGWVVRLKHGYADFGPFAPLASVQVGMLPTHWIGYQEGLWKYRVVAPVLMDFENQFSSADLGVSASINLPRGYGEFFAMAVNGTGYASPEYNRQKDYAGRLTLNLLRGCACCRSLQIAGYYYNGYTNPPPDYSPTLYRNRVGLGGTFACRHLSLGGEYDVSRDDRLAGTDISRTLAGGYSVYGELKAPTGRRVIEDLSLVGRYDRWDPNTEKGDTISGTTPNRAVSAHTRLIGGIAYQVAKNVRFVLDGQRVSYRSGGYNNVPNVNEDRLYQHLEVKF